MAEELGLAKAAEGKKSKKYVCNQECYLNGIRYHEGQVVETTEKVPEYFSDYKEPAPAEQAE